MNNIYFCYISNEYSTYIIAKDYNRARYLFQENIHGNYKKIAIIVNLYKKDIPEDEGIIKPNSETGQKYNISINRKERLFCYKKGKCSYMRKGPNDIIGFCMFAKCPIDKSVNGSQRLIHKGRIVSVMSMYDMGEENVGIRKGDFI